MIVKSPEWNKTVLGLVNDGVLHFDFGRIYSRQEHDLYIEVLKEVRSLHYQGLPYFDSLDSEGLTDIQRVHIWMDLKVNPVNIQDWAYHEYRPMGVVHYMESQTP
jgi:hypothetical protein